MTLGVRDLATGEELLVERLEELNRRSGAARWRPRRLILINWWLFDEQVFHFAQGRLVLHGRNASGKSTVLAAAITLVLDGNKSPERMDTFGGRGRSVRYYLVGDPDATPESAFYHESRTGYVALEFQYGASARTLTVGVGLYTHRNRPGGEVDFWGFSIEDGRRLGVDLALYDEQRVPLSWRALAERIGTGGRVVRSVAEYKRLVNRLVFGFPDEADYDDLLSLLLQLRSPKLNKDVRPSDVCETLRTALPPLEEGLLDQVSSTIERIDDCLDRLAETDEQARAARAVDQALGNYLNYVAQEAAVKFDAARAHRREVEARRDVLEAHLTTERARHRSRSALHERVRQRLAVVEEELRTLQAHEVFRTEEDLGRAREELARARQRRDETRAARERAATDGRRRASQARATEAAWHEEVQALSRLLAQAAEHARAAGWAAARDVVAHLTRAVGELRPPSADEPAPGLEAEAAQREAAVEAAVAGEGPAVPDLGAEAERRREALRAVLRARQEVARAERERETQFALLEQARETFRRAVDEARAAEGHLEALQDQAAAVLHAWREQARRASVPDFVLAAAIRGIREFPDVQPVVDRLRDPLVDWIERERQALDEEIARLRGERLEPQRRARELEAEIRRLREERDVPPPRAAATERARARLREAGIPAHPLYSVCDFAEGLSEAEQLAIERALEDTGLLDALVVPARRVGEVKALLADPRLADRWIEPRPQVLGYTLAEWLRPALPPGTEGLTVADVIAALRSVVCGLPSGPSVPGPGTVTGGAAVGAPDARDAGAGSASDAGRGAAAGPAAAARATSAAEAMAAVDASGAWRLGILAGSSERPEAARPRYIGEGNRRAYRRRRLDELEGELAATQRELARLDGEIAARAAERADLDEDRRALERLDLWSQLVHAAQRRRAAGEARAAADRRVQEAQSQEARARARWEEAHADYLRRLEPIPEARGRDEDGLHAMLRATEHVTRDLQLVAERLRNLHRRAREIRQWWEEHRRARAEQARLERRLRDDEAEVARREAHCRLLEQRLQAMGIDELRARIRRVTRRRHLLQRADRRMATLLAALGERLRYQEERFREAEAALAEAREREAHWQAELRQRLLAHPSLAEALALFDGDAPGDTEGPARAAAYLLRFRRSQEERRERYVEEDRQKAFNQLSHVFQQERGALAGYLPELDGSTGLVTFREQGRMLRPHELVAELEQRRRFEQQLLEQEERKLYEDVILRRLAAEIRRKIARAERWLAEVNRLLAERPLHGGEVLSLDWRPRLRDRSGSTSGNLQRLVELIRRDADTLTREEVEELIGHFRDNVNRIREQERGNVLAEGFRAALERVLDYREWFDFTLRTRRPGEPVRELTDQRFASRSGAEKSLAVFVPLLAAVHARYQAARPDAPRLVGLDEAFAGVDEGNIQAMFRLMVELDFAWIMTSEKLRGEGAALPACATYTMVPGEGIVVPVLSVWDGERRLEGLDAGAGPDEVPGDEEPGQQAAEPTPQTGTRPEAGRAGWSTLTPS